LRQLPIADRLKPDPRYVDENPVSPQRERYRSKEQVVVIVAFAVAVLIVGIATAHQAASGAQEIVQILATVLVAAAAAVLPLRSGLSISEGGVVIRNLFSTRVVPWSEIAGFRIGRYKLLGAVCLVDLKEGSSEHAWAIQIPNRASRSNETKEQRMIAQLNERLNAVQHRSG